MIDLTGEAGGKEPPQATQELLGPTRSLANIALQRVRAGNFIPPRGIAIGNPTIKEFDQVYELRSDDLRRVYRIVSSPVNGLYIDGFEIDQYGHPIQRLRSFSFPGNSLEWQNPRYAERLMYNDEELTKYLRDKYPDLTPKELSKTALDLREGCGSDITYSALIAEWRKKPKSS